MRIEITGRKLALFTIICALLLFCSHGTYWQFPAQETTPPYAAYVELLPHHLEITFYDFIPDPPSDSLTSLPIAHMGIRINAEVELCTPMGLDHALYMAHRYPVALTNSYSVEPLDMPRALYMQHPDIYQAWALVCKRILHSNYEKMRFAETLTSDEAKRLATGDMICRIETESVAIITYYISPTINIFPLADSVPTPLLQPKVPRQAI